MPRGGGPEEGVLLNIDANDEGGGALRSGPSDIGIEARSCRSCT